MAVQEENLRYEMSPEHKAQLALGREQSRIVRAYLQALRDNRPKRGRKRSPDTVEGQLQRITEKLRVTSDPIRKLHLMADRDRLQRDLTFLADQTDISSYEQSFVRVAREYSKRKGVSYQAWRELGVPASVLRQSGIHRAE